eukprot:CAMPEP_0197286984 /NCGR_PEP_ID=MMETSP0890-20130614/2896_1 /TAXON_ID=44058 ORGANISM="Aureoumbra lagunensis, Strain CCMP1510" /NCGR_SAMPLE_ID=MMETSP0890 /ASSEMBLY_ACC=CAM_ASM_000533 /LENGTH=592 /DNA_ID=CAMNT_0042756077 /DNA_START=31 /DNA_END=1809 /DNA_ORIENTATION=-
MKLGLFGRRRASIEKAELEWNEAQKRDEIVWNEFAAQLVADQNVWAELEAQQKQTLTEESTVIDEEEEFEESALISPQKQKSQPPAPPPRSPIIDNKSQTAAPVPNSSAPAQKERSKKIPPPPPHRIQKSKISVTQVPEEPKLEYKTQICGLRKEESNEKEENTEVKVRRHRRPRGARVAAIVESWERMAEQAESEAARRIALMKEGDKAKLAAYFQAKREALRQLKRDKNAILPPTFTNVASDPGFLDVLISSSLTTYGTKISYCILPTNEDQSTTRAWIVAPAPIRIRHESMGRLVIVAKVLAPDGRVSGLASSVFWLTPPAELPPGDRHPHGLTWIDDDNENVYNATRQITKLQLICAHCGTKLSNNTNIAMEARGKAATGQRGHYRCQQCTSTENNSLSSFVLCYDCALLTEARSGAKPIPPPRENVQKQQHRPPSVILDAGARRLWLSDPIHFIGNLAVIKEESYPMLNLLGGTLKRNPGLCVRLEGHTNSECGLDCDGTRPCNNNTCQANFGDGKGGAVGFSLSRASAVRDWLVNNGAVDKDYVDLRIDVAGLGGSRRIIRDTEAPDNHRNRRVEAHIIDFVEGEL